MSVQLLDKTRKINKLLHNNNSSKVVFNDICAVLKSLRRGGEAPAEAQAGEKPENAPPETALDRRWQSFPLVRRVRARFAPFLRAEEKLTELIKEESKKKEEGE